MKVLLDMKVLLAVFVVFYTATWLVGIYMSRMKKVNELKNIHLYLSLFT